MIKFPRPFSLFWGDTTKLGAIAELDRMEMVVVAEGSMVEPGSMLPTVPKLGVSTNFRSVWADPGSVYYPSQKKFLELCKANDWFLKHADGSHAIGWPGTWMFDVSHNACANAFVDCVLEILARPEFQNCKTIFADEMHKYVFDLIAHNPSPLTMFCGGSVRVQVDKANADSAWEFGIKKIIRGFGVKAPGVKLMPNGTYDAAHGNIGGHFWQSCNYSVPSDVIAKVMGDVNAYDTLEKNVVMHFVWSGPVSAKSFTKFCEYAQCFASLFDAYYQVEDNTFTWPFNYAPVPMGRFGSPVEYLDAEYLGSVGVPRLTYASGGNLISRQFENAEVFVNIGSVPVLLPNGQSLAAKSAKYYLR